MSNPYIIIDIQSKKQLVWETIRLKIRTTAASELHHNEGLARRFNQRIRAKAYDDSNQHHSESNDEPRADKQGHDNEANQHHGESGQNMIIISIAEGLFEERDGCGQLIE